ncbi:MAG: undecaprenyl-phosphate glucose phosphotransferase [Clostridia bacterium]|nr:undecaprenyl-phosphate glucose phosphotransferase [Clostridia bacterium]
MIRRNQDFLNRVNIILDMLLVIAAYVLASWVWIDLMGGDEGNVLALTRTSVLMACVYAFGVFALLSVFSFYGTTRTRKLSWKIRTIFFAVTLAVLIASTILFIYKLVDFSRGVLYLFYILTLVFLMGKYTAMRLLFNRLREKGFNLKHVIVIGTGKLARQFAHDVTQEKSLGFHIKGFVGEKTEGIEPYLGDYETLEEQLAFPDVQEAVIALDPQDYDYIREVIMGCEKNGIKYYVIPFYNDIIPANPVIEPVGNSKLIDMRANRLENMGWGAIKRIFDFVMSALGLIVLSPLMLLIALGVKLSGPGPILFKQTRVGYQRKEFKMLKFRSMKTNADENTTWTKNEDDRRTAFGKLIRKTSMDELPQLINVLKGDMSLVGPRPELPYFVQQFKESIPFYMVKHQVKPGITGWAQVNGYRGDTSITKRIELDLWYIDNWSIWLDIRILFRTIFGGMLNKEKLNKQK